MNISNTTARTEPDNSFLNEDGLEALPYLATESVTGTILNLFVIMVYVRMRKYTLSNVVFLMLSLSDLILSSFVTPLFIVYKSLNIWPLGSVVCHVFQIATLAQFPVSNQIIMIMALHRYLHLTKPFLADEKFNKRKILILSLSWLGPYLYVTILVIVYRSLNGIHAKECEFEFSFTYVLFHDILLN